MKLRVVGFDPSMNNWGIATGLYYPHSGMIDISDLQVICPVKPTGKQVRTNSKDIEAASQLTEHAWRAAEGAQAIFVEVPIGSQSANAMKAYGICVGILGAMQARGIPFFEVTPTEVKMVATNNKKATKNDMIKWAVERHATAPWPTYTKNGETLITEGKAEHMADAIGAIYAGVRSPTFRQLTMMSAVALTA